MSVKIGLTGLTGAGKSTAAGLFAQRGFGIVDADAAARRVTEKGSPSLIALASRFGEDILFPDGTLDRAKLASRAFSSRENEQVLNNITHPYILKIMLSEMRGFIDRGISVILDAPLLFESGLDKICDFTVTVVCPESIRLQRLMKRDGIDERAVRERMNAQNKEDYHTSRSNFIIVNDGKEDISAQVDRIISEVTANR